MVRPEVLRRRLEKLYEYLKALENLARAPMEEFLSRPELYGATERFLHLSIEALLDVGAHVISERGLGKVESYGDVARILAAHEYLDAELAQTFTRMVAFRNILVHEYVDIDRRLVYQILQEGLHDLQRLGQVFVRFL